MEEKLKEIVEVELARCIAWFFLSLVLMMFLTGYFQVISPSVWINFGVPIIITLVAFSSLVYVRSKTERTMTLEPGTQAYKFLAGSLAVLGVVIAVVGIGQYLFESTIFGMGQTVSGMIVTTIGMHLYQKS